MEEKKSLKIGLSTLFLILSIIVIIIMAYFIYKLNIEKTSALEEVSNLNNQVSDLENTVNNLQGKINTISNTINSNDENTSEKYEKLTEEAYNQMSENEYFAIQNVIQNTDGTITIQGRVYENVELTSISESEYNSLKSSGNITLFGEKFLLGDYEDFVPGYILKNSNGYGFYVSDNYELVNFNDTSFAKGTDKYYTVTLDDSVEFINNMSGETKKVSVSLFETINDDEFINCGDIYKFEFSNGMVSKITCE